MIICKLWRLLCGAGSCSISNIWLIFPRKALLQFNTHTARRRGSTWPGTELGAELRLPRSPSSWRPRQRWPGGARNWQSWPSSTNTAEISENEVKNSKSFWIKPDHSNTSIGKVINRQGYLRFAGRIKEIYSSALLVSLSCSACSLVFAQEIVPSCPSKNVKIGTKMFARNPVILPSCCPSETSVFVGNYKICAQSSKMVETVKKWSRDQEEKAMNSMFSTFISQLYFVFSDSI